MKKLLFFLPFLILTLLIVVLLSGFNKKSKDEYKKLAFRKNRFLPQLWQYRLRNKLIELSGANQKELSGGIIWEGEERIYENYTDQPIKIVFNHGGEDKRVFCHLLIPKIDSEKKIPAVIFSSGHGEGIQELLEEEESYQRAAAKYLAENGFVTLTCEPWAFWSSSETPRQGAVAINEALLKGEAIMGTYIDQLRGEIGILQSLPQVDPNRIGMAGASFGGAVTFYTTAIDERIKASFVSGFLTTFETTYFHHRHSLEMIIPGIYKYADIPDIAGLIAPRWVMFDNGETDNSLAMTPEMAEGLISKEIKPIFKAFGAEEKVMLNKAYDGHVIDREAALHFFQKVFNFDE